MSSILRLDPSHPEEQVIDRASRLLTQGEIIVYPTETLYGIGGKALDAGVVERIQSLKGRPDGRPILVIVPSEEQVAAVARNIGACARALMRAFWPGPLTLVLEALPELPAAVTGGTGSVGVRVPSHPVCLALLKRCGFPLTSTSANKTGAATPRTVSEIQASLGNGVALYLDAGELPESRPSTIVDARGGEPRLVREGAIPFEQILGLSTHSSS